MTNNLKEQLKTSEAPSRLSTLIQGARSAVGMITNNVRTSTRRVLVVTALVAPAAVSGLVQSGCSLDTRGTADLFGSGGEGGVGNDAAGDTMMGIDTGNFPDSNDEPETNPIFDGDVADADAEVMADADADVSVDAPVDADAMVDADADSAADSAVDADADSAIDSGTDAEVMDAAMDSGPVISDAGAPNVTFDLVSMGCFKAVVIDDGTKKVVWGSGDTDVCPTDLGSIYVPSSGHTLIVWVQDPTNNLLSFNSAEGFTVSKARCSTYSTAPTWTQIESDYSTKPFSSISNSALPPSYLFLKSCPSDAEYQIHK